MSENPVFFHGQLPTERVIVTDGNERSALAAVRSLGARGVRVYVGAETSSSLAGVSRYCQERFVYPSPWTHPQECLASLLDHAKRFDAGLIFPMTDIAVEILGEYQQGGGKEVTLPIPSLADYRALSDKWHLMEWAQHAGIPIPDTLFVKSREDLESVIGKITRWPVVVKPGQSLIRDGVLWKKTAVAVASDQDSLRRLYRERWYLKWPSLIQEQVAGYGEGVFGLFIDGKPAVSFAHRRLREKPPSGGVSVLRESIPLPPAMTDYAMRIMRSVNWQGVAMVEFKVAAATGVPYLMEVNGRFWGSLQLAIDAGVDFPWLLYQLAETGRCPAENVPYQVGIKSRWWLGDLDHMLIRVRRPDDVLNLPPGSPSRWVELKDFCYIFDAGTRSEVARFGDIKPGVWELRTYLQSLLRVPGSRWREAVTAARFAGMALLWRIGLACGAHRWGLGKSFPSPEKRLLFLCKGNICRSPFAAEYVKEKSKNGNATVEIVSAGLDTNAGDPADPVARCIAPEYGIDLSSHRTAVLSGTMVAKADLIFVMELRHREMLLRSFPEARSKTWILGHCAPQPVTNIDDPFGKGPEVFRSCYGQLAQACDGLCRLLSQAR